MWTSCQVESSKLSNEFLIYSYVRRTRVTSSKKTRAAAARPKARTTTPTQTTTSVTRWAIWPADPRTFPASAVIPYSGVSPAGTKTQRGLYSLGCPKCPRPLWRPLRGIAIHWPARSWPGWGRPRRHFCLLRRSSRVKRVCRRRAPSRRRLRNRRRRRRNRVTAPWPTATETTARRNKTGASKSSSNRSVSQSVKTFSPLLSTPLFFTATKKARERLWRFNQEPNEMLCRITTRRRSLYFSRCSISRRDFFSPNLADGVSASYRSNRADVRTTFDPPWLMAKVVVETLLRQRRIKSAFSRNWIVSCCR